MDSVAILAKLGLHPARCRRCRSIDFRGVGARDAIERAFLWLRQPYRCSLCGQHFFLFRWQASTEGTA